MTENNNRISDEITTRHEILRVPVSRLAPWSGNPRRISDQALAGLTASISRFGCVEPIVWNRRTGRVVGGHQRLKVLQAQGVGETEVVAVDLPETEEKALNISLNNRHITGEWTPDARDLLRELSESFDAFKEMQCDTLLEELSRTNLRQRPGRSTAEDDDTCEPPKQSVTKPGDLWRLGPHRLVCGDSTEPSTLALLMDGEMADGMFTDPPYNVGYAPVDRRERTGGKRQQQTSASGPIANDDLAPDEFLRFLGASFLSVDVVLRPGAGIYICSPAGFEMRHFLSAWPEKRWRFQVAIVWDKGRFALSRWDYHPAHELVLYGWKRGQSHCWLGKRDESSVWSVDMGSGRSYVYPTQKPVALVRRALLNSVPEEGAVLDPFSGSGSTLIAAETCGRRAFLAELDPRFCDAAVRRFERYTGLQGERVEAP